MVAVTVYSDGHILYGLYSHGLPLYKPISGRPGGFVSMVMVIHVVVLGLRSPQY